MHVTPASAHVLANIIYNSVLQRFLEFARGGVVCIPHDIAVLHMERYLYPKKDGNGKLLRMEPTWSKETERFYCANKKCIIKRHPYFWKGMLKIGSDTSTTFSLLEKADPSINDSCSRFHGWNVS